MVPINGSAVNGSGVHDTDVDVVVVGGGFGGCYALYKLRNLGFRTHLIEAGSAYGGVWHWNKYPGARVDSEVPFYQFSIPEVYKTWSWTQRFPNHQELKDYFVHVDKVLDLSKDTSFSTIVTGADFDTYAARWTVVTNKGKKFTCKCFVPATGSSHRAFMPNLKDMDLYKGHIVHSAKWPDRGLYVSGQNVAIVGSGATGVQLVQELSKVAGRLTVYVRNPNLALPMGQRDITSIEARSLKSLYQTLFSAARNSASGMAVDAHTLKLLDHTKKESREYMEDIRNRGGFSFLQCNYIDVLTNPDANRAVYDFWAEKTRSKIQDPVKREILAPLEPPYPFSTKRSSLEQDYFDCLDMDHVDVVDLKAAPLARLTRSGIMTQDGRERAHDVVILATGYDNMTGSLTSMGLRGKDGIDLKEKWKEGVWTHLGIMTNSCPNMFMIFGPQAPTAFTNAPVFIEQQVEFVVSLIMKMRDEGIDYLGPKHDVEKEWKSQIESMHNATVFKNATSSWYMGTNIPGKKVEQLNYIGGMNKYTQSCREALEEWTAWETSAPKTV